MAEQPYLAIETCMDIGICRAYKRTDTWTVGIIGSKLYTVQIRVCVSDVWTDLHVSVHIMTLIFMIMFKIPKLKVILYWI